MVNEMTHEELLGWFSYFGKHPPEWRDDHRTALLMQAMGAKIKPSEIFNSLKTIEENSSGNRLAESLKSSVMFTKMLGAVGGDNIRDLL